MWHESLGIEGQLSLDKDGKPMGPPKPKWFELGSPNRQMVDAAASHIPGADEFPPRLHSLFNDIRRSVQLRQFTTILQSDEECVSKIKMYHKRVMKFLRMIRSQNHRTILVSSGDSVVVHQTLEILFSSGNGNDGKDNDNPPSGEQSAAAASTNENSVPPFSGFDEYVLRTT